MPVQTTYGTEHAAAYKGQVADLQLLNSVSKLNKTGSTIAYGVGVFSDGENAMTIGASGKPAAEFIGVTIREVNRAYADGDTFGVPNERDGSVATHGAVWVEAGATVAKDEDVFVGLGADVLGEFTNAAGTGATEAVQVPNAKFLTGGAAGDLVKISLGLGG